jgi:transcription elongation factor Elf1
MCKFVCPYCGKRTMVKEEFEPKKYKLVCKTCGFQHKTLPKDDKKKGIV